MCKVFIFFRDVFLDTCCVSIIFFQVMDTFDLKSMPGPGNGENFHIVFHFPSDFAVASLSVSVNSFFS